MTAHTVPAGASSAGTNFAPEYSRSWAAFSSQSGPFTVSRTFSVPPVTFSQVSRSPRLSRLILNTRAANSSGQSGSRANRARPSSSPSTPSRFNAAPNQQGNSFRPTIRADRSPSSSSPVSRYRSISPSSHRAACSSTSPQSPEKSAQPSSSRSRSWESSLSRPVSGWSILFTKTKVGTPCRASSRHSVSVWPCTPSAPLTSSTAQSSTCTARSVSAEKSTCPGVSSRVIPQSFQVSRASLEKMVMPRSRSCQSVSRKASLWSTRPSLRTAPAR